MLPEGRTLRAAPPAEDGQLPVPLLEGIHVVSFEALGVCMDCRTKTILSASTPVTTIRPHQYVRCMVTSLQEMQDDTPFWARTDQQEGGKSAYQLFFLAAQGLQGLAFAAQGLHGLALTAQGLQGLALTAQGLQGLAFAAQGLHGFFCDPASAIPMAITNATISAKTATNDTIRLMPESPLY